MAQSLFEEWRREITQFQNQESRRASERELAATKRRTDGVVGALKRSATTMDPVLVSFR